MFQSVYPGNEQGSSTACFPGRSICFITNMSKQHSFRNLVFEMFIWRLLSIFDLGLYVLIVQSELSALPPSPGSLIDSPRYEVVLHPEVTDRELSFCPQDEFTDPITISL